MNRVRFVAVLFLLLSISVFSQAETGSASGTIDSIYTYNNGQVLFTGLTFEGASCSNNGGFYVASTHPQIDRFISMLLAAKAMKSTVTVVAKITDCWYPELTSGSYFYIK